MRRTTGLRFRAREGARSFRPAVLFLEDRLLPGDLLLGRALGAGGLAAVAGAAARAPGGPPAADVVRVAPAVLSAHTTTPVLPFPGPSPQGAPTAPAPRSQAPAAPADDLLDPVAGADPFRGGGGRAGRAPARHLGSAVVQGHAPAESTAAAAPVTAPARAERPEGGPVTAEVSPAGGVPTAALTAAVLGLRGVPAGSASAEALDSTSDGTGDAPPPPRARVHALFGLDTTTGGPFPSNAFTVRDRTQSTGLRVNLPYPDCAVYVSDCEDTAVLNELDGFNLQPRLSVPFDGPIDVNTVSSQSIFLVSLGDTLDRHDHGGQVVGINQVVWDTFTDTLHVESDQLLDQHTRYALIVTNGIHDASSRPVGASEEFRHFRREAHGAYREELEEALRAARRAGVRERDIVDASVFTTESATAVLEKIRDQIHAATPKPADFNLGSKGERTVFSRDAIVDITENQQNRVDGPLNPVPVILARLDFIPGAVGQIAYGKYLSPDYEVHPGEYIPPVATRTGSPGVQGENEVYFTLTLPSSPAPAGGWPVAIFGQGGPGGGSNSDFVIAASLATHGIATVSIVQPGGGFGPRSTLVVTTTSGETVTFLDGGRSRDQNGDGIIGQSEGAFAPRPWALLSSRDTQRQMAADLMQLVRVIEVGMDVDGDGTPDLDAARMYYAGHSFGGIYGSQFLAVEPDVRAGVITSGGGPLARTGLLSSLNRPGVGSDLGARVPSLINGPGVSEIEGVPVGGPRFNDNMPLRDGVPLHVRLADGTSQVIQSPVVNSVAGAMEIQEVIDRQVWAQMPGDPLAYAPHLRKDPLRGVPVKPVIAQFGKGDQNVPNPTESALIRAGGLADRTTYYRHDLAYAEDPTLPKNPHNFPIMVLITPEITRGAQEQIATFFASDGAEIIHPEPARFFETPIQEPLPEGLNYIP